MTDTTLKAIEAATGGTDLGAIQVLQGGAPVKIAKSTIVDADGNPISYAVLGVVGPGAAATAQRVHLSTESLAALEQITATVSGPIALDSATLAALESVTATISGPVALDPVTLAALEQITVTVTGSVEVANDAGNPLPVTVGNFPSSFNVASSALPTGAATETTLAAVNTNLGTDGATPPTIAGTGVRGWLRAIFETVAGFLRIDITRVNGATHSASNPLFADITDRTGRALGAVSGTVTANQGTAGAQAWPVSGPLTDAQLRAAAVPVTASGTLNVAVASGPGSAAASPLFAQEVVGGAAVSLTNPVPTRNVPADLAVQAQGAAAAAVTLTIPAAGPGLFHYIDVMEIQLYSTAARTGAAAPVSVSSTNLPGNLTTLFPTAGAIGTIDRYAYSGDRPIRSAAANTATTIVCPAVTGGLWHVKVVYSTGP